MKPSERSQRLKPCDAWIFSVLKIHLQVTDNFIEADHYRQNTCIRNRWCRADNLCFIDTATQYNTTDAT